MTASALPSAFATASPCSLARWTIGPSAATLTRGTSRSYTIRGSCEDYRATATYDFALDTADLDRKVTCPLLVLWGRDSHTERVFGDVLAIWKERGEDVRGRGLDAGHYVNEEAPEEVLAEFLAFFPD